MSDSPPPADAAAKPAAAGTPKALLLLLVLNLGASGFLVFKTVTTPPAAAATAEPKKEEKAEGAVKGPVVPLDPFVVNLDEPGNPRYLKLTLQLEMSNEDAAKSLEEGAKQPIRDQVLGYLSGLKVADTLGEANKQKIRDGVLGRVGAAIGKDNVRRLFITDFVVQ